MNNIDLNEEILEIDLVDWTHNIELAKKKVFVLNILLNPLNNELENKKITIPLSVITIMNGVKKNKNRRTYKIQKRDYKRMLKNLVSQKLIKVKYYEKEIKETIKHINIHYSETYCDIRWKDYDKLKEYLLQSVITNCNQFYI